MSPRGRTVVFGLVLVVLVAILFPAVVTAKYVVVIDDGSHGFEKHGPAKWWHKVRGIGFGGDMFWTWNNKNRVDNYVVWRPNLKYTGYYKVYVFIPRNYAYTKNAYYEIYHAHGKTVKKIDQSRYYDTWVYLGKYYFKAGKGYVKLTDKTGERWATKKIGFDAIKFELVRENDVNGDGFADIIIINGKGVIHAILTNGNKITKAEWLGNPHGQWGWSLTSQQDVDKPLGVGDINGDGFADIVIVNGGGYIHAILTNGKKLQEQYILEILINSGAGV